MSGEAEGGERGGAGRSARDESLGSAKLGHWWWSWDRPHADQNQSLSLFTRFEIEGVRRQVDSAHSTRF